MTDAPSGGGSSGGSTSDDDSNEGAMQGTTVVITGGSSGVGRAAAIALSAMGADIAVVGRDAERTRATAQQVGGTAFLADFDRLDDVRDLAAALLTRYERIDVLANNAGGMVAKRALTVDGHERTIQSNHLAPFLLTNLLLPRLAESAAASGTPVRVISTSSAANLSGQVRLDDLDRRNRWWLGGWRAYCAAKLANIMFTRELARRTGGDGIEAFAFHPGYVGTAFGSDSAAIRLGNRLGASRFSISPEEGAAPLIHLASAQNVGIPTGTYFDRLVPFGRTAKQAMDAAAAERLWAVSTRETTP